ncbi:hypothetical protein P3X46_028353 [Hevea brasiliensis]|uniref:Epidermal patterning factor-like protein n=1 Tax=Hevea brasiliensis TaxID=3981 RepID=A0ABQ9KNT4_HEVBR|nr:hypothetical protein P3X46_028353 [Hevea brasiliensis]
MKLFLGAHKSFLLLLLFLAFIVGKSLQTHRFTLNSNDDKGHQGAREEQRMEVYPTGSSLPDCSHACGPCVPCKRVMVSFKCSIGESCPIVYICLCKGKYYHVP